MANPVPLIKSLLPDDKIDPTTANIMVAYSKGCFLISDKAFFILLFNYSLPIQNQRDPFACIYLPEVS